MSRTMRAHCSLQHHRTKLIIHAARRRWALRHTHRYGRRRLLISRLSTRLDGPVWNLRHFPMRHPHPCLRMWQRRRRNGKCSPTCLAISFLQRPLAKLVLCPFTSRMLGIICPSVGRAGLEHASHLVQRPSQRSCPLVLMLPLYLHPEACH